MEPPTCRRGLTSTWSLAWLRRRRKSKDRNDLCKDRQWVGLRNKDGQLSREFAGWICSYATYSSTVKHKSHFFEWNQKETVIQCGPSRRHKFPSRRVSTWQPSNSYFKRGQRLDFYARNLVHRKNASASINAPDPKSNRDVRSVFAEIDPWFEDRSSWSDPCVDIWPPPGVSPGSQPQPSAPQGEHQPPPSSEWPA